MHTKDSTATSPKRHRIRTALRVTKFLSKGSVLPLVVDAIRNNTRNRFVPIAIYVVGALLASSVVLFAIQKPKESFSSLIVTIPGPTAVTIGVPWPRFALQVKRSTGALTDPLRRLQLSVTPITSTLPQSSTWAQPPDCTAQILGLYLEVGYATSYWQALCEPPSGLTSDDAPPGLLGATAVTDDWGAVDFTAVVLTNGFPDASYFATVRLLDSPEATPVSWIFRVSAPDAAVLPARNTPPSSQIGEIQIGKPFSTSVTVAWAGSNEPANFLAAALTPSTCPSPLSFTVQLGPSGEKSLFPSSPATPIFEVIGATAGLSNCSVEYASVGSGGSLSSAPPRDSSYWTKSIFNLDFNSKVWVQYKATAYFPAVTILSANAPHQFIAAFFLGKIAALRRYDMIAPDLYSPRVEAIYIPPTYVAPATTMSVTATVSGSPAVIREGEHFAIDITVAGGGGNVSGRLPYAWLQAAEGGVAASGDAIWTSQASLKLLLSTASVAGGRDGTDGNGRCRLTVEASVTGGVGPYRLIVVVDGIYAIFPQQNQSTFFWMKVTSRVGFVELLERSANPDLNVTVQEVWPESLYARVFDVDGKPLPGKRVVLAPNSSDYQTQRAAVVMSSADGATTLLNGECNFLGVRLQSIRQEGWLSFVAVVDGVAYGGRNRFAQWHPMTGEYAYAPGSCAAIRVSNIQTAFTQTSSFDFELLDQFGNATTDPNAYLMVGEYPFGVSGTATISLWTFPWPTFSYHHPTCLSAIQSTVSVTTRLLVPFVPRVGAATFAFIPNTTLASVTIAPFNALVDFPSPPPPFHVDFLPLLTPLALSWQQYTPHYTGQINNISGEIIVPVKFPGPCSGSSLLYLRIDGITFGPQWFSCFLPEAKLSIVASSFSTLQFSLDPITGVYVGNASANEPNPPPLSSGVSSEVLILSESGSEGIPGLAVAVQFGIATRVVPLDSNEIEWLVDDSSWSIIAVSPLLAVAPPYPLQSANSGSGGHAQFNGPFLFLGANTTFTYYVRYCLSMDFSEYTWISPNVAGVARFVQGNCVMEKIALQFPRALNAPLVQLLVPAMPLHIAPLETVTFGVSINVSQFPISETSPVALRAAQSTVFSISAYGPSQGSVPSIMVSLTAAATVDPGAYVIDLMFPGVVVPVPVEVVPLVPASFRCTGLEKTLVGAVDPVFLTALTQQGATISSVTFGSRVTRSTSDDGSPINVACDGVNDNGCQPKFDALSQLSTFLSEQPRELAIIFASGTSSTVTLEVVQYKVVPLTLVPAYLSQSVVTRMAFAGLTVDGATNVMQTSMQRSLLAFGLQQQATTSTPLTSLQMDLQLALRTANDGEDGWSFPCTVHVENPVARIVVEKEATVQLTVSEGVVANALALLRKGTATAFEFTGDNTVIVRLLDRSGGPVQRTPVDVLVHPATGALSVSVPPQGLLSDEVGRVNLRGVKLAASGPGSFFLVFRSRGSTGNRTSIPIQVVVQHIDTTTTLEKFLLISLGCVMPILLSTVERSRPIYTLIAVVGATTVTAVVWYATSYLWSEDDMTPVLQWTMISASILMSAVLVVTLFTAVTVWKPGTFDVLDADGMQHSRDILAYVKWLITPQQREMKTIPEQSLTAAAVPANALAKKVSAFRSWWHVHATALEEELLELDTASPHKNNPATRLRFAVPVSAATPPAPLKEPPALRIPVRLPPYLVLVTAISFSLIALLNVIGELFQSFVVEKINAIAWMIPAATNTTGLAETQSNLCAALEMTTIVLQQHDPNAATILSKVIGVTKSFDAVAALDDAKSFLGSVSDRVALSYGIAAGVANAAVLLTMMFTLYRARRLIRQIRRCGPPKHLPAYGTPAIMEIHAYVGLHCVHYCAVFVAVLVLMFCVTAVIAIAPTRDYLWATLEPTLITVVITQVISQVIMRVSKVLLIDGWAVVRPELHALLSLFEIVLGFFAAIFGTVIRWGEAFAFVIVSFALLDTPLFPFPFAFLDSAHYGFAAVVAAEACNSNPIMLAFAAALLQGRLVREIASQNELETGGQKLEWDDAVLVDMPMPLWREGDEDASTSSEPTAATLQSLHASFAESSLTTLIEKNNHTSTVVGQLLREFQGSHSTHLADEKSRLDRLAAGRSRVAAVNLRELAESRCGLAAPVMNMICFWLQRDGVAIDANTSPWIVDLGPHLRSRNLRRAANRWWLLYLLHRNPSLRASRKRVQPSSPSPPHCQPQGGVIPTPTAGTEIDDSACNRDELTPPRT